MTDSNYVLTLGDFQGGGIWQQGASGESADVAVESSSGNILRGFVSPVKNRIVRADPKRLHRTMPWSGGPKWTVIAHTIGATGKLAKRDVETLGGAGFPLYSASLSALAAGGENEEVVVDAARFGRPWRHLLSGRELEEEMMNRLWSRRVLDEEEQLMKVVPNDLIMDYEGVIQATQEASAELHLRELRRVPERWNEEQNGLLFVV